MMQFGLAKLRREIGDEFDMRVNQVGVRVFEIVTQIDAVISEKFGAAEASFVGEQRRVTALDEGLRRSVQSVDGANLERIASEMQSQDGRDQVRLEFLQNMFLSEMNSITRLIGIFIH